MPPQALAMPTRGGDERIGECRFGVATSFEPPSVKRVNHEQGGRERPGFARKAPWTAQYAASVAGDNGRKLHEIPWLYLDSVGSEYGPVAGWTMRDWLLQGRFPVGLELRVRLPEWENHVPLRKLFPDMQAAFVLPPAWPELLSDPGEKCAIDDDSRGMQEYYRNKCGGGASSSSLSGPWAPSSSGTDVCANGDGGRWSACGVQSAPSCAMTAASSLPVPWYDGAQGVRASSGESCPSHKYMYPSPCARPGSSYTVPSWGACGSASVGSAASVWLNGPGGTASSSSHRISPGGDISLSVSSDASRVQQLTAPAGHSQYMPGRLVYEEPLLPPPPPQPSQRQLQELLSQPQEGPLWEEENEEVSHGRSPPPGCTANSMVQGCRATLI